jgi:hypothetical protein
LSVITILPDAILRWIGSGTESSSYGALKGEEMGTGFHGAFLRTGSSSLAFRAPPGSGGGGQKGGSGAAAADPKKDDGTSSVPDTSMSVNPKAHRKD